MKFEIELADGGTLEVRNDPGHLSVNINDRDLKFVTIFSSVKEDCDYAVSLRRGRKHKWLDSQID